MSEIKIDMENLTDEQQKQLMKLIEIANNSKRPNLSHGDKYYFITTFGNISHSDYCDNSADNVLLKNGNVFLTKEGAEFEVEKRKVIAELQNYADKHNENTIDWRNTEQPKWKVYCNYECGEWFVNCVYTLREQNSTYFTSSKICVEAVKSIGEDRLKKYLFEIV